MHSRHAFQRRLLATAVAAGLVAARGAVAGVWSGAVSTNFETAANWKDLSVPDANALALFTSSTSPIYGTVNLENSRTVQSIAIIAPVQVFTTYAYEFTRQNNAVLTSNISLFVTTETGYDDTLAVFTGFAVNCGNMSIYKEEGATNYAFLALTEGSAVNVSGNSQVGSSGALTLRQTSTLSTGNLTLVDNAFTLLAETASPTTQNLNINGGTCNFRMNNSARLRATGTINVSAGSLEYNGGSIDLSGGTSLRVQHQL